MNIQLYNIKQNTIFIFDIEYDQTLLVQISYLILSKCGPDIYRIAETANVYVKPNQPLTRFFTRYTNITNDFLCDNGVDLTVAKALVEQGILNINPNKGDVLLVSHGVKNDLDILARNGFTLKQYQNRYCTYNNARRLLKRNEQLTLHDIAAADHYYLFNPHNACSDV